MDIEQRVQVCRARVVLSLHLDSTEEVFEAILASGLVVEERWHCALVLVAASAVSSRRRMGLSVR